MGYHQTAYVGYGAPVLGWTYDLMERLETADLSEFGGVGYLFAGPYDNDFLFFAAHVVEAEIGEYNVISKEMQDNAFLYDVLINRMAYVYNVRLEIQPTWFVVSDLS